jgi:excinuclease UvrABC ATPase subunit
MKQPIKKKEFKKFDIKSFKEQIGLTVKSNDDLVKSAAEKPTEFIALPQAFADALKLPGIPMGYLTIVTGWSNTGKSTIKNCLIASCINNGIMPVIFETEGNFDFKYAIDCG